MDLIAFADQVLRIRWLQVLSSWGLNSDHWVIRTTNLVTGGRLEASTSIGDAILSFQICTAIR